MPYGTITLHQHSAMLRVGPPLFTREVGKRILLDVPYGTITLHQHSAMLRVGPPLFTREV